MQQVKQRTGQQRDGGAGHCRQWASRIRNNLSSSEVLDCSLVGLDALITLVDWCCCDFTALVAPRTIAGFLTYLLTYLLTYTSETQARRTAYRVAVVQHTATCLTPAVT